MPSVCFVADCDSGSKKQLSNGTSRSFFSPQSDEMLCTWSKAVGRKDKVMTKKHKICELHFRDEEIEREYVTQLPDGSINKIKRGKPLLISNAVPSLLLPKSVVPNPEPEIAELSKWKAESTQTISEEEKEKIWSLIKGKCLGENSFKILSEYSAVIPKPEYWTVVVRKNCLTWLHVNDDINFISKQVILLPNMQMKVIFGEVALQVPEESIEPHLIPEVLEMCSKLLTCAGCKLERPDNCHGYVLPKGKGVPGPEKKRCIVCKKHRRKMLKKKQKQKENKIKSLQTKKIMRNKYTGLHRKNSRLKMKIQSLREKAENLKRKCASIKEDVLNDTIKKLPKKQQLTIKACFTAAKLKSIHGIRYTTQWIYECVLMRIKSKKLYNQLRRDKILVLPSLTTLARYLKNIKTSYGFQEYIFQGLEQKSASMEEETKRGIFAIDEVKLTETLSFDRKTLKIEGFTDLGEYTPDHQKGQRGDHALVIMFQPFRGNFVQTIGCFLSKGSANGTVLHKIILEGIALAEKAGLFVDAVVTDGASWNRAMWKKFGITEKNISTSHPCDEKRRLWFFSDFPHLLKIIRNFVTQFEKNDVIYTPDGGISKKHWYALLELLEQTPYALKVNFKLSKEHLDPKYYQKMNVALAFQFFNVHHALEIYENRHEDLEDCEGTKSFCKRITDLINAMNTRTPANAMRPGNEAWNVVENFIQYLERWEQIAKENKFKFLTENCCFGLKISLKATLEICKFLTEKSKFTYVMTGRLNQDCLERFFGMMRECCGANDHPDSTLFIQMYKLVSTYSLVKPPKGCNVEGSDVLESLISLKKVEDKNERRDQFEGIIDTIIDRGINTDVLSETANVLNEHDYNLSEASEYAVTYLAGYMSKKGSRFAKYQRNNKPYFCADCEKSLILSEQEVIPERHKLIEIKSRGFLKHPSIKLYNLISVVENSIMQTIKAENFHINTCLKIAEDLELKERITHVGCSEHARLLTRRILIFYIIMRMLFICKEYNKRHNQIKELTRQKRKAAKLAGKSLNKSNQSDTSKTNCCDSSSNKVQFKEVQPRKRRRNSNVKNKNAKKQKTDSCDNSLVNLEAKQVQPSKRKCKDVF